VEALIGKRPYEEKKSLGVTEEAAVQPEEKPVPVAEPAKEEQKSIDEQTGNIGLAPSL
jgi:hypothetical protein